MSKTKEQLIIALSLLQKESVREERENLLISNSSCEILPCGTFPGGGALLHLGSAPIVPFTTSDLLLMFF